MHIPTHPHAQVAIELAEITPQHRGHVNSQLYLTGTPRSLYTLARVLRAAQIVDEINAAHPAIVAQAVREFDGTNLRQLAHRHDLKEVDLYRALRRRNGKCLPPRGLA